MPTLRPVDHVVRGQLLRAARMAVVEGRGADPPVGGSPGEALDAAAAVDAGMEEEGSSMTSTKAAPGDRRGSTRRLSLVGGLVLCLLGGSALATAAQDPSVMPLPPLDRTLLEATCEANSGTAEDLETCLDIVARVLAPDPPVVGSPAPVADLPFQPVELQGRGDRVARFDIPEDAVAIADIRHSGRGNFAVWTLDPSGERTDLLVNVIGRYRGTVLFDEQEGQHSVAFEVTADGPWEATVRPLVQARRWDATGAIDGPGDDVLLLLPPSAGLATTSIRHRGGGNVAVWAYSPTGADLLVNEVGRYDGEMLLADGTFMIEISADGDWSMSAPG